MSQASAPKTLRWTESQSRAIGLRGGNVIVSASAGAGKTAVLSERVLRLVTEPADPSGRPAARIDELLILTFTEKAARQMRDRIERSLREALASQPSQPHLREALDGLDSAWIMTIDAFCRRVVVENFYRDQIKLPPNPRLLDESEQANLERETIGKQLDALAAQGGEWAARLSELMEPYYGNTGELVAEIQGLIRFLSSLDRPGHWLALTRERLAETIKAHDFTQLPEAALAWEEFARSLRQMADALAEACAVARTRGGDPATVAGWERLAQMLDERSKEAGPFAPDLFADWLAEHADPILSKLSNKAVAGEALYRNAEFKSLYSERLRKRYESWRGDWFPAPEAALLEGARLAARQAQSLLELAESAVAELDKQKRRRGWVTFNDIERYALQVLTDSAQPDAPSDVAYRYQGQFAEVLVDEYQDTSPLQDAIVRRVARQADAQPTRLGNLFLVGDYKQSIYRFRWAEPGLFLEKLESAARATDGGAPPFHRVNLPENFRSRPGILNWVNACFERLMDEAVGELQYTREEHLVPKREDLPDADPACVEIHWLPYQESVRDEEEEDDADGENGNAQGGEEEALEGIQAQAAWVARRVKEMTDPERGLLIADENAPREAPALRRARPEDCAILLRAIRGELGAWIEALQAEGLKVRTPGVDPLFTSIVLTDLLNALRAVDNPFQDLPLAAFLRSPMGGLSDGDLLAIRMAHPKPSAPFHEAVWLSADRASADADESAIAAPLPEPLRSRLAGVLEQLDGWRALARMRPAVEVANAILNDTAYETWIAARPNAAEALEHLDYLRGLLERLGRGDGAANPLARCLSLIERAREQEQSVGELPEPSARQPDAVHLLTVHKSKGLEFPIVFLPRLERPYQRPAAVKVMLDRELGIAQSGYDGARQVCYATVATQAFSEKRRRQDRSEQLRLLYVAMTRARERLVLVGQAARSRREDSARDANDLPAPLNAQERLHARAPADLLRPVIQILTASPGAQPPWLTVQAHDSIPSANRPDDFSLLRRAIARTGADPAADWAEAIRWLDSRKGEETNPESPLRLLPATDPAQALTLQPAKTTVTQLRQGRERLEAIENAEPEEAERFIEEEMRRPYYLREGTLASRQPRWTAQATRLAANQRGSAIHALLAQIDLKGKLDSAGLREQAHMLLQKGLLAPLQDADPAWLERLDWEGLEWFFQTPIGRQMAERPGAVSRELPFTTRRPLSEFSPGLPAETKDEFILVQGVIDAVIDNGQTATVLDYKTDFIKSDADLARLTGHYRLQVELYQYALWRIWDLKKVDAGLVFLSARRIVMLEEA